MFNLKNFNVMSKDILCELDDILTKLQKISDALRREELVCRYELESARMLGLKGSERISHYNDWMRKYGLDYLCVDE